MTSDKKYIENIIKKYGQRNKRAVLFGIIGVIFGVAAYMVQLDFEKKTHELAHSISSILIEGTKLTDSDIRLMKMNNQLPYVMGFRVGQLMNTCATASGLSIGYCLYLLLWARKERIIIELYEKTKI